MSGGSQAPVRGRPGGQAADPGESPCAESAHSTAALKAKAQLVKAMKLTSPSHLAVPLPQKWLERLGNGLYDWDVRCADVDDCSLFNRLTTDGVTVGNGVTNLPLEALTACCRWPGISECSQEVTQVVFQLR